MVDLLMNSRSASWILSWQRGQSSSGSLSENWTGRVMGSSPCLCVAMSVIVLDGGDCGMTVLFGLCFFYGVCCVNGYVIWRRWYVFFILSPRGCLFSVVFWCLCWVLEFFVESPL